MKHYAIASRVFQFKAGPHKFCFHACPEHAFDLRQAPMNFMLLENAPIVKEDPADEIDCDLCPTEPRS
jgi:hypothetical protein